MSLGVQAINGGLKIGDKMATGMTEMRQRRMKMEKKRRTAAEDWCSGKQSL